MDNTSPFLFVSGPQNHYSSQIRAHVLKRHLQLRRQSAVRPKRCDAYCEPIAAAPAGQGSTHRTLSCTCSKQSRIHDVVLEPKGRNCNNGRPLTQPCATVMIDETSSRNQGMGLPPEPALPKGDLTRREHFLLTYSMLH